MSRLQAHDVQVRLGGKALQQHSLAAGLQVEDNVVGGDAVGKSHPFLLRRERRAHNLLRREYLHHPRLQKPCQSCKILMHHRSLPWNYRYKCHSKGHVRHNSRYTSPAKEKLASRLGRKAE